MSCLERIAFTVLETQQEMKGILPIPVVSGKHFFCYTKILSSVFSPT